MADHEHEQHEHTVQRYRKYGELNEQITIQLRKEAEENIGTSLGYFLHKAAECETQSERSYWLNRVDSAKYMAARQVARDKLSESARRNIEADEKLFGTEAELEVKRVVGNAVVLQLLPGQKEPDKYSLVRRKFGEQSTEGYSAPRGNQWVIQNLQMNTLHQFAVVSELSSHNKQITGPWIDVSIGNVDAQSIYNEELRKEKERYRKSEEAEAEKQRLHDERMRKQREDHNEQLKRQREQAKIERDKAEKLRIEREKEYERQMADLHKIKPTLTNFYFTDKWPDSPTMMLHIEYIRGEKMAKKFFTKLNGTVYGEAHDGVVAKDFVMKKDLPVPRGTTAHLELYGWNQWGRATVERDIEVPQSLSPEPPLTRMQIIMNHMKTYTGRRTRSGKPYVRDFRKHAGMDDISWRERNRAFKELNS